MGQILSGGSYGSARVVVVTGGSAGVGQAGRAGVRPVRRPGGRPGPGRGRSRWGGGAAIGIPIDECDQVQVEEAADRVERALGPIDVWVNNAMNSVFAPFWGDRAG